ncbi:uncharacterized protein LOC122369825 [Amphibalanus amphitrite]|uniref:uncharacterized protein LOC122369825 n=1 Tax=Amphibalanus amphitrite TaxID=1232801 RepID=UPI001C8FBADA|nr:uncharacterized protein LOC122369825 [Amphibalanus amphitrite]
MFDQDVRTRLLLSVLLAVLPLSAQKLGELPGNSAESIDNCSSVIQVLEMERRIVIRDKNITTLSNDTFSCVRNRSDAWKLDVINTRVARWRSCQHVQWSGVTVTNSAIGQLDGGGISVQRRRESESCRRGAEQTAVRLTDTTIDSLLPDGIVMEVARGSLTMQRCTIGALAPAGIRLAFRVQLAISETNIDRLSAGAFCNVCSDVVHISGSHLQPIGPLPEAALRLGSPACRVQCPQQRLRVRKFTDNRLPGEAVEALQEPLRRCRQGLPLVTGCGGEGSDGGVCGDLRLAVGRSSCLVRSARLLQLVELAPWWTDPAVLVAAAVALTAGFLVGLLTLHLCQCRRRRPHSRVSSKRTVKQKSVVEVAPDAPSELEVEPTTAQHTFHQYRERVSLLWRGGAGLWSTVAREGSIYARPAPPVDPPAPSVSSTGRAHRRAQKPFSNLYENLHGSWKGRRRPGASGPPAQFGTT